MGTWALFFSVDLRLQGQIDIEKPPSGSDQTPRSRMRELIGCLLNAVDVVAG